MFAHLVQIRLRKLVKIVSAGETLSKLVCIINDKERIAGRTGVGAAMRSKNLKAITAS